MSPTADALKATLRPWSIDWAVDAFADWRRDIERLPIPLDDAVVTAIAEGMSAVDRLLTAEPNLVGACRVVLHLHHLVALVHYLLFHLQLQVDQLVLVVQLVLV